MSSNAESQQEELEVLRSIYQGDDCFKEISLNIFQYKVGIDNSPKSFILELSWGENYPQELPVVSLDTFYNKHLLPSVKQQIREIILDKANEMLELAMTFSLFEFAKENCEQLLLSQPEILPQSTTEEKDICLEAPSFADAAGKPKEKKEQLTKAQKRKLYNRQDVRGEMPRGYDWVDIVKHLSQSGRSSEALTTNSSNS